MASEVGCTEKDIVKWEESATEIAKGTIFRIAEVLSVPVQYLFFKSVKVADNIPDFRTPENRPAVLSPAALSRIRTAASIVDFIDDSIFSEAPKYRSPMRTYSHSSLVNELQRFYQPIRDREGWVNSNESFKTIRVNIERAGAIVMCESIKSDQFRGFCFSERNKIPLIFVNTANQRPATKLFTLMHECAHLVMQSTGVSDPSIIKSTVEKTCNSAVAEVMMPAETFEKAYQIHRSRTPRTIASNLSREFGVSKQAAAIRVSELSLDKNFYKAWRAALPKNMPVIEEEDEADKAGGGGGISSQLARFGYLLPSLLSRAIDTKKISGFDAYRVTRLAPDTVKRVAEMASSRLGDAK